MFRIRKFAVYWALLLTLTAAFAVFTSGQTTIGTARCPGGNPSVKESKVDLTKTGDVNIIPCAGKQVLINGSPISSGGGTVLPATTSTAGKVTTTTNTTQVVSNDDPKVNDKYYVDVFGSLPAALSAVGTTNNATLVLSTNKTLTSSLTIPANVTLEPSNVGTLSCGNGVKITVLGTIPTTAAQVFNKTGACEIDLSKSKNRVLTPEMFGGKGQDNVADDAALTSAVLALGTLSEDRSGKILFPDIGYRFANQIDLHERDNIVLEGAASGWNGGNATWIYTGAGASPFVSVATSRGLTFRFLKITHTDLSFTGDLMKAGSSNGGDTTNLTIENCAFYSPASGAGAVPRSLLNLDVTILASVKNSYFTGGDHSVLGRETGHSIENTLENCNFKNYKISAVHSIGETWTIKACGFHGGAFNHAKGTTADLNYYSQGLTFTGNYTEGGGGTDGETLFQFRVIGAFIGGMRVVTPTASGAIFELIDSSGVAFSGVRIDANPNNIGVLGTGTNTGIDISGVSMPAGVTTSGNLQFTALGNSGIDNQINGGVTVAGYLARTNKAGVDVGYITSLAGAYTSAQMGIADAQTGLPNRSFLIQGTEGGSPIVLATQGLLAKNFTDSNVVAYPTKTFTSSNVDFAATDFITVAAHNLTDKTPITFSSTGTLPAPLVGGTTYYAAVVDANRFAVATSAANINNGILINFTNGGTGTHTLTTQAGAINVTTHGLTLGQTLSFSSTGTLPVPLAVSTTYYAIPINADYFSVATTFANAQANVPVNITSAAGGGTHSALVGGGIPRLSVDGNGGAFTVPISAPSVRATTGDVYVNTSTKGIILKSPDGTCYRFTVANGGALSAGAAIACP